MKYITRSLKADKVKVTGVNMSEMKVDSFELIIPDGLTVKKRGEYVRENVPYKAFAVAQFEKCGTVETKSFMSVNEWLTHSHEMLPGESLTEAVKRIYNSTDVEIIEA